MASSEPQSVNTCPPYNKDERCVSWFFRECDDIDKPCVTNALCCAHTCGTSCVPIVKSQQPTHTEPTETEPYQPELNYVCPAMRTDVRCKRYDELCDNSDKICPTNSVCCQHPCGSSCVAKTELEPKPQPELINVCPPMRTDVRCSRFDELCDDSDKVCPTNSVCCLHACGSYCIAMS